MKSEFHRAMNKRYPWLYSFMLDHCVLDFSTDTKTASFVEDSIDKGKIRLQLEADWFNSKPMEHRLYVVRMNLMKLFAGYRYWIHDPKYDDRKRFDMAMECLIADAYDPDLAQQVDGLMTGVSCFGRSVSGMTLDEVYDLLAENGSADDPTIDDNDTNATVSTTRVSVMNDIRVTDIDVIRLADACLHHEYGQDHGDNTYSWRAPRIYEYNKPQASLPKNNIDATRNGMSLQSSIIIAVDASRSMMLNDISKQAQIASKLGSRISGARLVLVGDRVLPYDPKRDNVLRKSISFGKSYQAEFDVLAEYIEDTHNNYTCIFLTDGDFAVKYRASGNWIFVLPSDKNIRSVQDHGRVLFLEDFVVTQTV